MDLFDKETIEAIAVYSRGIPRLINVLCDSSLVYGFADELQTIGPDILDLVYEELKSLGTFTDYDAKPAAQPPSTRPVRLWGECGSTRRTPALPRQLAARAAAAGP